MGYANAPSAGANRRSHKDAESYQASKARLEIVARRIVTLSNAIGEAPAPEADDATVYNQLIGSTDRLREEIATAHRTLERLVEARD
jgi:hypothetical protein